MPDAESSISSVGTRVATCCERLGIYCFRFLGIAVFFMVLYFPAHKGILLGYVPVISALILALLLWRWWELMARLLQGLSSLRYTILILAVPAAVQAVLILIFQSEPRLDAQFVMTQALHFAQTGEMDPLTYYAPAQTWWFAFFFRIFGASFLVAQLSLIPLALGVTWVSYSFARYVGGEERARLAGVLVAYYPACITSVLITPYYFYLYTLMIVLGAFLWMLALTEKSGWGTALAGGLAAGIGALTKAVMLIAPVQVLVFWLLSARGRCSRSLLLKFGFLVLGMALVVAPWTYRNLEVFDEIVLVNTSGGMVLYSANNPTSNGIYSLLPDTVDISSPHEFWQYSKQCSARAKAFIRDNPGRFMELAFRKLFYTWGSEATFAELINVKGTPRSIIDYLFSFVLSGGWAFAVTLWACVSVSSIVRKRARVPGELLIAIIVLSHALVYCIYEGGDRHHVPLVPLLILFAVSGLSHHGEPRRSDAPSRV